MTENDDLPRDDRWSGLLARWRDPALPAGLDERVMASYRSHSARRRRWWRVFLTASVRVPLPLALAMVLVALVSAALALRARPASSPPKPAMTEPSPRHASTPEAVATTTMDLTGFEAASEVKVTILSRGDGR